MILQKKLELTIQKAIESHQVAGANFMVLKDGEEILYAQAGMADREAGIPLQKDAIFRLYSQTKPVTAAAAMLLFERGEIDLFQTVDEFLPSFKNIRVEEMEGNSYAPCMPLTLHNLLGMTSGLSYPNEATPSGRATARVFDEAVERLNTDHEMTTIELAERLGECPLAFTPGMSWQYGTSADVLGAVIEVVTGMKLGDFMEQELFKPLGMEDTGFWLPEEKRSRMPRVYETVSDGNGPCGMREYTGNHLAINNAFDHEPGYMAGGAGLASTLTDYSKFAAMLMNGGMYGGRRILKPKTVEFMTGAKLLARQQASFDNWTGLNGFSYGNLMRICKEPGQAGMLTGLGEYGWDGWLGVYFANLPKERLTILMGTQKRDAGTIALTRKLRNLILSEQV